MVRQLFINITTHTVLSVLLLLLSCATVHAHNDEELFLQGYEHYHKQEYAQALDCYQRIKRKGRATFHNMGNCYHYLKKSPQAVACWKRAQQGASYHEYDMLAQQINEVMQEINDTHVQEAAKTKMDPCLRRDDVGCKNNVGWRRFFNHLCSPISLLTLQLLFLLSWFLFFILLWRSRNRTQLYSIALLCILISILFLTAALWFKYAAQRYPHALVCIDTAVLYAGPQNNYQAVSSVHYMDELLLYEQGATWCKATTYDGTVTGWIETKNIEIV